MIHDLEPLRRTAARDALIVAHFANQNVYSIHDLLRMLVPSSGTHTSTHFTQTTGLCVELGIIYLLDLVRELGSIDGLCRRLTDSAEGPLPRIYVVVLKRYLAECVELTAHDAAAASTPTSAAPYAPIFLSN